VKVAIWHNLPSGGGKRALYEHVRGLLERGHVVESWCPPTADQAYLPLGRLVREHVVSFTWTEQKESGLTGRLVGPYRNVTTKLRAMDEHCRRCAEEINAGDFDVLLSGSCAFFRVTSIARHVRLPALIYLQEPYRWLYEALPRLPWLARPSPGNFTVKSGYRFVEDLISVQGLRIQAREEVGNAQAFQRILVNSFFSRESVLRAYGLEAEVCYLGVDTDRFAYRRERREPFLISVGAFVPEKNPRFAVEALARVQGTRPRLVWVGNIANGQYLRDTRDFASSMGVTLDARIGIPDSDLVDLLNRATAMLYAPRLEPFGLGPLEGNACGLPVIAVAEGGVRETVVPDVNGILVPPDPGAMAAAIERLMGDPGYARRLGENGVALVADRWSVEAAQQRIESILKTVVSPARDLLSEEVRRP